jgi:hypothetical protein
MAMLNGPVNCAISLRTENTRPCSSRGVTHAAVRQILTANIVSAEPMVETDCVAHTMRNVRKPFGGGVYVTCG